MLMQSGGESKATVIITHVSPFSTKSSSLPVSVFYFNLQKNVFLLLCRRIPPTKVPWVKTSIPTVLLWVHLIQVKAGLQCA